MLETYIIVLREWNLVGSFVSQHFATLGAKDE